MDYEEVFEHIDPDYDPYEAVIRESIERDGDIDPWADCPVWEIGESRESFITRMREYYNK